AGWLACLPTFGRLRRWPRCLPGGATPRTPRCRASLGRVAGVLADLRSASPLAAIWLGVLADLWSASPLAAIWLGVLALPWCASTLGRLGSWRGGLPGGATRRAPGAELRSAGGGWRVLRALVNRGGC